MALAGLAVSLVAWTAGHRTSQGQAATSVVSSDTVVIYGPQQFAGSTGQGQTYVEQFTTTVTPGRFYWLRLVNGAPDGTRRASKVVVKFNGVEIVSQNEVSQGVAELTRPVAIAEVDTIQVTVAGSGNPYITLSVLSTADSSFDVFGPSQFTVATGSSYSDNGVFTRPSDAAAPYRVYVTNGASDGTDRATSASLTLNGVQIVSTSELTSAVGSLTKPVTLDTSNTYGVTVNGSVGSYITVRFTATDTTRPVLTITAPAPQALTNQTSIDVTGTIADYTLTTVVINGLAAVVTDNASYAASVPLTTEGENVLTVSATDAAGRSTDSTRTVIRDTQAPSLSVTSPVDGLITAAANAPVSGTVSDAASVAVNVNGVPLVVQPGGDFAGEAALLEGVNVLTVTATDAATNSQSVIRTVTRDNTPPDLTVTTPADGAIVDETTVEVSGSVSDATPTTVTINGAPVTVGVEGVFTRSVELGVGQNTITVVATDAANNITTVVRTVTRSEASLPPDPATVAPPLDSTSAVGVFGATEFLYSGPNPIQTGVAPGTIVPVQSALLRGRVLTREGDSLPGVTVSVLGHSEYGQTLSRADGVFDLVINGGGQFTVDYVKPGFLPAQRHVTIGWNEATTVPDVALVPLDSAVTTIDFSAPVEVARGSVVTDTNGTRQATLLFEQGTVAAMVLPDGSVDSLPALQVRATEYTVGANGRAAMPGALPPASAYTYAVELSADEALAAGARSIEFSQPVGFYLDNFRQLPTGVRVPLGVYDRDAGQWIPEQDGRVIKILSTSPVQLAASYPDTTTPASQALLDSLGISAAELAHLGTLYQPGTTLWRVELTHFSIIDLNFAVSFVPKMFAPLVDIIRPDIECQREEDGSIIGCEEQTLGEDLDIAGTPFTLHYQSDRTIGYAPERLIQTPPLLRIDTAALVSTRPLGRNEFPSHVTRIRYVLDVAGKRIDEREQPLPQTLSRTIEWDGRDVYGRPVNGTARARLSIRFAYPTAYSAGFGVSGGGGGGGASFGGTASAGSIAALSPESVELHQVWEGTLGSWDNRAGIGLGGWSLSPHHVYDPNGGVLFLGSGERRTARALGNVARIIGATRGRFCSALGCGEPRRIMSEPGQIATDAAGRVVIPYDADGNGVTPPGKIRILGTGGTFVDSIPNAGRPYGVAVAPDGAIYLAEPDVHRVRRRAPDGTFSVVAGTGTPGFAGDGGPATAALLNWPTSLAFGPDGSLYIADQNNHRIRRIGPDGVISTMAGTGSTTNVPTGDFATATPVPSPVAVAVAPDGSVVYGSGTAVRRVAPDGRVIAVAGYTSLGPGSTPATSTTIGNVRAVAVERDGAVLVATPGRVWRTTFAGAIEVVAGERLLPRCVLLTQAVVCDPSAPTDGDVAPQTRLENVVGIAVAPDGSIYLSERHWAGSSLAFIRVIRPGLPGVSAGHMLVASADGSEVYEFDASGRHLRTRDGLTGKSRLVFDYSAAGLLTAVRDSLGNTTTIERDAAGTPTAIVAPFGQRTSLTLDANGYLQTVSDPAGNRVALTHTASGLLTELRDPRDQVYRFAYDSVGRLVADSAPNGGAKELVRATRDSGHTVTVTTAMDRATSYAVDVLTDRSERRERIDPAGFSTVTWRTPASIDSTQAPDGTRTIVARGGDPRFGAQVPLAARTVVRLPSNDSLVLRHRRTAVRADSANPFSVTEQRDSVWLGSNLFLSVYDQATQRVTTTTPEGRQRVTTLDSLGRVRVRRTPGLDSVVYRYDARGRLDQVTTGGRVTGYTYDALGRLATTVDPLGRVDSLFYDDADRLTRRVLPGGREVGFAYDSSGNLTAITPPGRPAHAFAHTAVDLDSVYTPPSPGSGSWATAYHYNLDRQLTAIARPGGDTISFGYDAAGRPSTVTFDRGTVGLGYSATTGQLTSLTGPGATSLAFTYDGMLPTTVTWAGPVAGSVGVGYTPDFRVTSQTVNGADTVAFGYNRDGLLTAAGALGLKRQAQTGFLERDSVGGVLGVWGYDPKGALASYTASSSGTPVFQTSYVRDSLSRITELTETVGGVATVVAFTYDSAGRLATVRRDGVLTASYAYDANGNRLELTTPGGTVTGSYDAQDRLLSYGSATYSYAANGELTERVVGSDTTRYTYDALGNLTQVRLPDGTLLEYLIDPQNRRIGRKVNGVLVQGLLYGSQLAPVAELDGAGAVVSRFIYATRPNVPDYVVKGGQTYRLILDHLGSVRLVVNAADGTVAQRIEYDEFGQVTQNTNPGFQPFGYAGGLYDSQTGLVRFGARDYDAQTGRWTAKDPIGFNGGDPNLYAYALNNPINVIDSDGRNPLVLIGAVIGAASGAAGAIAQNGSVGEILLSAGLGAAVGGAAGALPFLALPPAAGVLGAGADLLGQGIVGVNRILRARREAQGRPVCIPAFTPNWGSVIGAGLGATLGAGVGGLFETLPGFAASTPVQQAVATGLAGIGPSALGLALGNLWSLFSGW